MAKDITLTPLYYDHVFQSEYTIRVLVGGRFSGKSQNAQVENIVSLESNNNYKLLVIEDLETGMADGYHAGLRERIEEFEHEPAYNDKTRTAYIKNHINGNEVLFRGYATDQQRLNVKKLTGITEIVVEEGEWMDYQSFIGLLQQLRGGNEEDRKLTILMNPTNPQCFVNQMLIMSEATRVIEYFEGTTRPKVFEKVITTEYEIEGETRQQDMKILVVLSTHHDNPFLTDEQRGTIEQLRFTDPDLYLQLGEAKFIGLKGSYFNMANVRERQENAPRPLWRGDFTYRYENHEIIDSSIEFVESNDGYIKIYTDPRNGYPYVLSGDTAGDGSDWNTGIVTDNTTGKDVAAIRINNDEDLYARQMYCLGKWYGELNGCNGNAMIGIEINHSTHPNKEIIRLGYDNIYIREQAPDSISGRLVYKYGFRTTGTQSGSGTRPVMLGMLRALVREQPELIVDKELLNEMAVFVKNDKGKPEAAYGFHDDMVICRAINCYIADQQTRLVKQPKAKPLELPPELTTQQEDEGDYISW